MGRRLSLLKVSDNQHDIRRATFLPDGKRVLVSLSGHESGLRSGRDLRVLLRARARPIPRTHPMNYSSAIVLFRLSISFKTTTSCRS